MGFYIPRQSSWCTDHEYRAQAMRHLRNITSMIVCLCGLSREVNAASLNQKFKYTWTWGEERVGSGCNWPQIIWPQIIANWEQVQPAVAIFCESCIPSGNCSEFTFNSINPVHSILYSRYDIYGRVEETWTILGVVIIKLVANCELTQVLEYSIKWLQ